MYLTIGIIFLLCTGAFLAASAGKLTTWGAVTGGLVGWLIYLGAGLTGLALLAAFFIVGTVATSYKKEHKRKLTEDGRHQLKRTAGQVLANGGMAALLGALAWYFPDYGELLCMMMAASLSSAMADTVSSELGTVFGRRFYSVLSGPGTRGDNGVISIEGTLLGVTGSLMIGVIYLCGSGAGGGSVVIILLAGTVGNLADSVLGATLEHKKYIGNNAVNFLNTLIAALVAGLLF